MQWHKGIGNCLLSTLAISQLVLAGGCTTMPSGPQSEACLQSHNNQVDRLGSADLVQEPVSQKETVLCSADATTFGFIAQLPNTNQLDPDVKFPGEGTGTWKLGFGTMDRNIAGQYDVPLLEAGVYRVRVAVKSDQPTNFAMLCGFNGLGEDGGFAGQEKLVHVDTEWRQANCTFVIPEGKSVSSVQLGFRATPSDTARESVHLWVGPMQITNTGLSPADLEMGDASYPDERQPPMPQPSNKPHLGI